MNTSTVNQRFMGRFTTGGVDGSLVYDFLGLAVGVFPIYP